jgi:hypothetical protein
VCVFRARLLWYSAVERKNAEHYAKTVMHAQFDVQRTHVYANGIDGDARGKGHRFIGVPRADQTRHLALTGRKGKPRCQKVPSGFAKERARRLCVGGTTPGDSKLTLTLMRARCRTCQYDPLSRLPTSRAAALGPRSKKHQHRRALP